MKTKTNVKFRSLKILLLMSGVMLAFRLANGQCVTPPSGLVAWWPGNGNALDIGSGNSGTLINGVTYAPGEVGQAFRFNGNNGYIQVSGSYSINGSRTIEGWVYVNANTDFGLPILVAGSSGTGDFFGIAGTSGNCNIGQYRIYVDHWSSSCVDGGIAVTPNAWNHVAMTYDGATLRFYVNGVAGASVNGSLYNYNLDTVTIGGNLIGGSTTKPTFNGLIDEISIYNRALSDTEIQSIYSAGAAGKCQVPFITSQPQSQFGYWGQSVSFSVGALPPPLNYLWQSNGMAISGATNQTLTLTNLQNSFAAGYTVVVANSYGSVTSAPPANLTINPAGVAIALYPGVKIDGVVGLTYGIQYSTNLANTNGWIGLTNLTFTQPMEIWYDAIPASQPQRFYRVLQGPIPIP